MAGWALGQGEWMAAFLYSAVQWGRMAWASPAARAWEWSAWALRSGPWSGPASEPLAAWWELASRLAKPYGKPSWRCEEWDYAVEVKTAWETPFGRLIRFEREGASTRPKLLIVAPMSGHYPTLLRDTAREMGRSCDVFLTEWINPRDVPLSAGDFSLDDYVDFLRQSLRELASLDGRPAALMSVCQPTVPALAAAAFMWEDKEEAAPSSLVMIGGPIDARKSPTATNNFATERPLAWFESSLISVVPLPFAGAGRRVYPGFLQHMGFVAMNPSRHAQAHRKFFDDLVGGRSEAAEKHRDFYDEYNAVADLAAPYYLQTIKKVFQDFDLPLGRLELCGRLARPEAIGARLMTIEGALDDISGAGQTHSAHELCVNAREREQATFEGVGHYGVFSGSAFAGQVAPRIAQFVASGGSHANANKPLDPA
jgi:poly(3-hydroxybutyrate) depolymerase